MKFYNVEITVSGINNKPEIKRETISAQTWEDALSALAIIMRETMFVVLKMEITETSRKPFHTFAS